jgi:hypothetical protein
MTKTMQYAAEKSLVPVIHANKPFAFTTQGVQEAFRTVASHHPHGKVVIHVADDAWSIDLLLGASILISLLSLYNIVRWQRLKFNELQHAILFGLEPCFQLARVL